MFGQSRRSRCFSEGHHRNWPPHRETQSRRRNYHRQSTSSPSSIPRDQPVHRTGRKAGWTSKCRRSAAPCAVVTNGRSVCGPQSSPAADIVAQHAVCVKPATVNAVLIGRKDLCSCFPESHRILRTVKWGRLLRSRAVRPIGSLLLSRRDLFCGHRLSYFFP